MPRLISRGFNSADYGSRINCAAKLLLWHKILSHCFLSGGTLEVNYLSVSARSDARVLLYGERPSEMHSHYSRVRWSLSRRCPYDYSFILSPLSGNTIKLRYAVAQCQDEDTQEINYVCSFSAQIHRSAPSDLLSSISRSHRSFSLRPLCQ